ncbi:MAG TPA: hypothetical protein VIG47_08680 [Gemmatimonadaceae bacterium]|jgi:hypothetical protein
MIYRVVAAGCRRAIAYATDARDAGEHAGRAELLRSDARTFEVRRVDGAPLTEREAIAVQLGRDWGRSRANVTTNRALCRLAEGESK